MSADATVDGTVALLRASLYGQRIAQLLAVYARDLVASGRLVHFLPDRADETFHANHPPKRPRCHAT